MDKEVARFVLLKGIKWWVAMGLSAPCSMLIEIKASRREESAELLIKGAEITEIAVWWKII
jgi:hypothetical protein